MAEYDRIQKKQESRAVANCETGNKQLRGFMDNRATDHIQFFKKRCSIQFQPFPNRMAGNFTEELTEANTAAANTEYEDGPGPYVGGTPGFDHLINTRQMFKWVYQPKNGIVIINPQYKHSVASGGGDVTTAGHGQLISPNKLWINNDTGHYQTTMDSLHLSIGKWQALGYNVELRERIDFRAVLAGLGAPPRKKIFGIF